MTQIQIFLVLLDKAANLQKDDRLKSNKRIERKIDICKDKRHIGYYSKIGKEIEIWEYECLDK